jgi:Hint domain
MTQIETGGARSVRVTLPLSRSGFGLGTGILTTDGELPVEFLEPGDRIVTFDRGAIALSRVIVRSVPASALVRVRPAVLDAKGDGRDFLLSAQQKIVLRGWRAKAMFGKPAVLVAADRLVDGAHMARLTGSTPMRLFQLVFDDARHVVQVAGGTMLAASARLPVVTRA